MKRKIILDLAITLDGFIEGKHGEVDWCIMDPEMDFIHFLNEIDTIIYGRKSYDLWGQFRPGKDAPDSEKEMWGIIHRKEKYVCSRTPRKTDNNAVFLNNNIAEEVNQLKNKPGKDIWLYGGASMMTTFIHAGLIDEYRLSVHPVILGEGTPLFVGLRQRLNVTLVQTRTFSSGVVQLIYHSSFFEERNR